MKLISFPNASVFWMDTDNRVVTVPSQGANGTVVHSRVRAVGADMPNWVAEGVVFGEQVGGTCLMCGLITMVGVEDMVLDEVRVIEAPPSPDAGGQGQEPGEGISPGKRGRRRGAGTRRAIRSRGGSRAIAVSTCKIFRVSDCIFLCTYTDADHADADVPHGPWNGDLDDRSLGIGGCVLGLSGGMGGDVLSVDRMLSVPMILSPVAHVWSMTGDGVAIGDIVGRGWFYVFLTLRTNLTHSYLPHVVCVARACSVKLTRTD